MVKEKTLKSFGIDNKYKNYAGNKELDDKARDKVIAVFEKYNKQRTITRAGETIDIVEQFDKFYRFYRMVFNRKDHNYKGKANFFSKVSRKAVDVSSSNRNRALFGRPDYFSVRSHGKNRIDNTDQKEEAFEILNYYSKREDWETNFKLAGKQQDIYGPTCVETMFWKESEEVVYRSKEPVLKNGEPLVALDTVSGVQTPVEKIVIKRENIVRDRVPVEARDIYRFYCNANLVNPTKGDIIYRDSISAQTLLDLVEQEVYNKDAVTRLLKSPATYDRTRESESRDQSGNGKSIVEDNLNPEKDGISMRYEVLRFQGLFTTEDEKTGLKINKQFFIDIGERNEVLRIQVNPLPNGKKTFSAAPINLMIAEFYTGGIIDTVMNYNILINDKENQSLDAITWELLAPYLVDRRSKIKGADILKSIDNPHWPIITNNMEGLKKMQHRYDVSHIRSEIAYLEQNAASAGGAVPITEGLGTGTQADRSGKAIGEVKSEALLQYADSIATFEKMVVQESIQKAWDFISLFGEESIQIDLNGKAIFLSGKDIVGRYSIDVSSGSHYIIEAIKKKELLDFVVVSRADDVFAQSVDRVELLKELARLSRYDLEKYVNPENMYNQLQQTIQKLVQAMNQQNDAINTTVKENDRLRGELQQTSRAGNQSPPMKDIVASTLPQGG